MTNMSNITKLSRDDIILGYGQFIVDLTIDDVRWKSTDEVYKAYLSVEPDYTKMSKVAFVRIVNECLGTKLVRKMINGMTFKIFLPR